MRTNIIYASIALACLLLAGLAAPLRAAGLTVVVPGWYDPAKLPVLQKAIDDWNASHETPVAAKVLVGKREAIYQKIAMGAGRPDFADAALIRNEWLGPLEKAGAVVPMSAEIDARLDAEALPALRPALIKEGRWYAIPFDADVLLLWCRRDLAETAGLTPALDGWNEARFLQLAKILSANSPAFAFPAQQTPHAVLNFLPWYFSRGGEIRTKGDTLEVDPQILADTLSFLQSLVERGYSPANAAALEPNDIFNGLAGGKFGMAVGGSWQRGMLEKQSRLAEQFVALPIPGSGDKPGASLVGGWSFVVFKNAGPETLPFLLTLVDTNVQGGKLRENGFLPVMRVMLEDRWFTETPDGPAIRRALETGRALPFHQDLNALLDDIATKLAEVFLGKKTPAEISQSPDAGTIDEPASPTARLMLWLWLSAAIVVVIIVIFIFGRRSRSR